MDYQPMNHYRRFLVISLGTGSPKLKLYDADMAAKWGTLGWLIHGDTTPLVDVFMQASGDMVDFHLSAVFRALRSEENYLRIQVSLHESLIFFSYIGFDSFE